MIDELQMAEYKVICHIDNCSNAEIEILISAAAQDPIIICGVCSQQIIDVTKE